MDIKKKLKSLKKKYSKLEETKEDRINRYIIPLSIKMDDIEDELVELSSISNLCIRNVICDIVCDKCLVYD